MLFNFFKFLTELFLDTSHKLAINDNIFASCICLSLLLVLPSHFVNCSNPSCSQVSPCECTDSASDKTVHLKNETHKDEYGGYVYTYNPCSPVKTCGDLGGVAICQVSSDGEKVDAGSIASATFSGNLKDGNLIIKYSGQQSKGLPRTSEVAVVCHKTTSFTAYEEAPPLHYSFTLKTPAACLKHGLSVGSILCIIALVLVVVYLVAGLLVNKFLRKMEGREVWPNYGFWAEIPGLVRDGCVFTWRKVRRQSTYDAI